MPFSPLAMSFGALETPGSGEGLRLSNASCAEKVEHLPPPFSSTSALTLLGVVLVAIVALSLTTHHCHKGKMKKRKIEKAQEEYERDHCSPVPARAKPDLGRCTIIRPPSRDTEHQPTASDQQSEAQDPSTTSPTVTEGTEAAEEAVLEAVAVS